MTIQRRSIYTVSIGLVIFIAIWQISCFQYTLKWDAIDITLPWRHFVSDTLINGILPWWNPYQFHGFAQGLSLETWYPLALLLGAVRRYDLYSLNLEYLLHLLIAAHGFFRLARALKIKYEGALWGALVFPLTGFFVANAQHTGWIASGAWMPHVFASFLIWRRQPNLSNTLLLVILIFLLVSGGYIAFSVVTAYILFTLGLIEISRSFLRDGVRDVIWRYGRLVFCIFCICSILIVCLWQLKSQIDRGVGLSGDSIYKGSLRLKHLVSLIFPFSTVKGSYEFWTGDQSMMNVYMGIPAIALLTLSLRKVKSRFFARSWLLALASLSLALAVELPFRTWLNSLPLFDLFRFPSLFRYFMILMMVLIGARMVSDMVEKFTISRKLHQHFIHILPFLTGLIAIAGALTFFLGDVKYPKILRFSIETVPEAIVFQASIHILLLCLFLLLLKWSKVRIGFFNLLLIFSALDLMISCQLNGRVSIFSDHSFASVQPCMRILPSDFPLPAIHDFIGSNPDRRLQFGPVYRNTNTLYKRVGWDGYTPYQYQRFIDFEKTPYYQKSLDLPLLFVSKPISKPESEGFFYKSDPILNLSQRELCLKSFTPNKVVATINLNKSSTLVLNQNYVDNWQVKIDGHPNELVHIDHSLMGVRVPTGQHEIEFEFVPGNLYNALIISLFSFLLCFFFYFWLNRASLPHQLFILLGLSMMLFFWSTQKKISSQGSQNQWQINTNDRFLDRGDLGRLKDLAFDVDSIFSFVDESNCLPTDHHLGNFLLANFRVKDSISHGASRILILAPKHELNLFHTYLGFESYSPHWRDQGIGLKREADNSYQSLDGRKYSANISLELDDYPGASVIRLSVDHRNDHPIDAALVCSIVSEDGEEVFWKSMKIPYFDAKEGQWKQLEWRVNIPSFNSKGHLLRVHIWNRGQTDLQIDNLSMHLLSK